LLTFELVFGVIELWIFVVVKFDLVCDVIELCWIDFVNVGVSLWSDRIVVDVSLGVSLWCERLMFDLNVRMEVFWIAMSCR
jgi:hypothetical protein